MAIVVTGMACRSAAGASPSSLVLGLDRARARVKTRATPLFSLPAAIEREVFPLGRRDSARDSCTLAECLVAEALGRAFSKEEQGRRQRTIGLVLGTTGGTSLHFCTSYGALCAGRKLPPENDLTDYLSTHLALACRLPAWISPQGPRITLSNACTTGADAIALGADLLTSGLCSCVVCGGVDTVGAVPATGFTRLLLTSKTLCRPFDRDRDGLTLGEGGAVLVLEREDQAMQRQAPIVGFLIGYGQAADAYHPTAPHPEGRGLRAAIAAACAMAGIEPTRLAFVNAHATATRENDAVEGRVLLDLCPSIPLWASKGGTGHTLAAAGALEAIASLAALALGCVPKTWGFRHPDPALGLTPTLDTTAVTSPYALSTSLGFGGGNTALLFRRTTEPSL